MGEFTSHKVNTGLSLVDDGIIPKYLQNLPQSTSILLKKLVLSYVDFPIGKMKNLNILKLTFLTLLRRRHDKIFQQFWPLGLYYYNNCMLK